MKRNYVEQGAGQVKGRAMIFAGISSDCLADTIRQTRIFHNFGVGAFISAILAYYPISADHWSD
jgi:dihydrodipicolinate synthase/N-acetylneuraminate lyase